MESVTLPPELRAYLAAIPDEAGDRIVQAPAERWRTGAFADPDGRQCLRGHAEDWRWMETRRAQGQTMHVAQLADESIEVELWFRDANALRVASTFDRFVREDCGGDVGRAVEAIKAYLAATRNPALARAGEPALMV